LPLQLFIFDDDVVEIRNKTSQRSGCYICKLPTRLNTGVHNRNHFGSSAVLAGGPAPVLRHVPRGHFHNPLAQRASCRARYFSIAANTGRLCACGNRNSRYA
jgi:hypothetical protein